MYLMNLTYKSTRGGAQVTASQAILKGLADDGGLYVPSSIPALDVSVEELSNMTYQEVAYEVMKLYLTDFTPQELKSCIDKAYDSKLTLRRSRLWFTPTGLTIWSFSTALQLPLRIWLCPSCLT